MIHALLVSASIAAAAPAQSPEPMTSSTPAVDTAGLILEAEHAIAMGRLNQAKIMAGRAIGLGASGALVERLLANLDFANGNYASALTRYEALRAAGTKDLGLCGNGAVAALKLGRVPAAQQMAECAVESGPTSWRAWNARGVVADLTRDWKVADESYARARELSPKEATLLNNMGWSKLLRGDWPAALPLLEQAAALDPSSQRINDNLELVRLALTADLPARRSGEADGDWAARLNDAGVAAELRGEKARAVAAFTKAVETSPVWYARAWNNLQAASAH